jgi:hypothetical protein
MYIYIYGGFLKYGYSQIMHFRLGVSRINHPFWGTHIYGDVGLEMHRKILVRSYGGVLKSSYPVRPHAVQYQSSWSSMTTG